MYLKTVLKHSSSVASLLVFVVTDNQITLKLMPIQQIKEKKKKAQRKNMKI